MKSSAKRRVFRMGLMSKVLLLILLLCASPAVAEPTVGHQVEHGGTLNLTIGAKGSYLAALEEAETAHLAGGGVFAEMTVIPEWLEVEFEARVLGGHGTELPLDLVFKKPFELSEHLGFFVGAGPTLVMAFAAGENSTTFGAAVVAGVTYWLSPHLGLSLEADYNLISSHGALHELGSGVGVAYRL